VDRDEAARAITESVIQLFFSAENQGRFFSAAEELGVSPPTLKALLELTPGEPMPMRDLAERWQCDASFVTVTCDGLEAHGLVERRVAEHDRRIKLVDLTPAGAEAQARARAEVYGPRAGFDALTEDEQRTLAELLTRLAAAQAEYDETLLDQPGARAATRRMAAQRTRGFRGHGGPHGHTPERGGWREHLAAHREEIRRLKEEVARVSAEVKKQARQPVDDVKAAKNEVKAEMKAAKADIKAEIKAATNDLRAQALGARDEALGHVKGRKRPG
jgi:DNA-binding MarR family transcriptional regulator